MKILFCHDGPIKKDQDNNYYGIAHNDDTFQRYYSIAEELKVLIRVNDISKEEAEEKYSKIKVKPLEIIEYPNISSVKGMLFRRNKAKEIIKKEVLSSDYIIARLPSMAGFIAVDYARKLKKPYLVELVTCPWDAFWNHSFKGKLMAPFMYHLTKEKVKKAPFVLYVTNQFLQNRYPTEGKRTNCSNVALHGFGKMTYEKRIDKIQGKRVEDPIIIGTTAAVDIKFKGQQYVIEALGKLKERGMKNFEYHLVGGGNPSFLKSLAKKYDVEKQVKFLGVMQHKEVFGWLDSIDIYVQPSRQEGLPRALIEAMSRGITSFGARTAGIPELIDDEFIFSNTKNNIEEICNILMRIDSEVMEQQSLRNFNESRKYDAEIVENRRKSFFMEFKQSLNEMS